MLQISSHNSFKIKTIYLHSPICITFNNKCYQKTNFIHLKITIATLSRFISQSAIRDSYCFTNKQTIFSLWKIYYELLLQLHDLRDSVHYQYQCTYNLEKFFYVIKQKMSVNIFNYKARESLGIAISTMASVELRQRQKGLTTYNNRLFVNKELNIRIPKLWF